MITVNLIKPFVHERKRLYREKIYAQYQRSIENASRKKLIIYTADGLRGYISKISYYSSSKNIRHIEIEPEKNNKYLYLKNKIGDDFVIVIDDFCSPFYYIQLQSF